jgi:uncharacterized protein YdeI (YjbR/CyaY-like superfamily)
MAAALNLPTVCFPSRAEWEAWLETNHSSSPGVWVKLAKKGSGAQTVSRPDALEVALCYGWIDSQAASLDDAYWLQRFTPRTRRSKWSRINRKAAEELIAAGKMRPPGLAEVELAKGDGRWDNAYASPRSMTVPEDLQRRLDENPAAREFFEQLDSQNRYAILYRIQDAKRLETRARRIDKFLAMLLERKTIDHNDP